MNLEALKKLVNEVCSDVASQQGGYSGKESPSGGKMARTDLVTIAKDAQELVNMFGDESELPDWVESKLTKAADYLNSVKKYIGGEIVRQQGGLMENIPPEGKTKEGLPTMDEVAKTLEEAAKTLVVGRVLESLFAEGNRELYERANTVFNELLNLRDELGQADSYMEEGSMKKTSRFKEGDKVKHKKEDLGTGTVVSRKGNTVGVRWPSGMRSADHNMLKKI